MSTLRTQSRVVYYDSSSVLNKFLDFVLRQPEEGNSKADYIYVRLSHNLADMKHWLSSDPDSAYWLLPDVVRDRSEEPCDK